MTTTERGVAVRWQFPDAEIRAHLNRLSVTDFRALRAEIGDYMIGQIQDRFDDQRLVDGSPMPQSAAAIARSGQTLMASRLLYKSYGEYQLVRNGVTVGSNSVYARIHHAGGMAGRGLATEIEARPVLGVNDADLAEINELGMAAIRGMQ
jgi:phage gpG-like protein